MCEKIMSRAAYFNAHLRALRSHSPFVTSQKARYRNTKQLMRVTGEQLVKYLGYSNFACQGGP